MMAEGYITASFNALNQPMAIWSSAYGTTFQWFGFDPLGRCVKRWRGTATGVPVGSNPVTYFYYDGWNLVQEGLSASAVDRTYVHGGRVDEIVASQVSGVWYNHHYDGQGNCILLSKINGDLQEQYDYDAFGFPYFYDVAGNNLAITSVHTRFLFTGREWLSDLRIYDYRTRQYQPELGRFLQPDPKEFAAGDYNLYRYCHNDPVNKSDPTGLKDEYVYPTKEKAEAARRAIDRLARMRSPIGDRIRTMRENKRYTVRFIPVQKTKDGLNKNNLQPHAKGQEWINRTTERNAENARNGVGSGSVVEFDPDNWNSLSGPRDPVIGAGHEVDHAVANLEGKHLSGALEEQRAQAFEREVRDEVSKGK
jgi:RHS repeat-associated protein